MRAGAARFAGAWLIVAALVPSSGAAGASVDRVSMPPAAAERVVRDLRQARTDSMAGIVGRHLDEASRLLSQIDDDDASFGRRRSLVDSKRHELHVARSDVAASLARARRDLAALGAWEKLEAWDRVIDDVDARLARVIDALDRVSASARTNRRDRVRDALAELYEVHGRTKERVAPVPPAPRPTVRIRELTRRAPAAATARRPAYARGPAPSEADDDVLLTSAPDALPPAAQSCNATAADLAENPEVRLTPEIRALAESLGYAPARLFTWVADTIAFEPYWGSLKGATGTLVTRNGNATDHASLLIALLRASNVPARYVQGLATIHDERAHRWLGAPTFTGAAAVLAAGGIFAHGSDEGMPTLAFRHVWVEACVPYGDYRGSGAERTGYRWIPLDPSFKTKTYRPGIATDVVFDASTTTGYLRARTDELPHEVYARQVEAFAKTQPPDFANTTLADVGYVGALVPQAIDVLPSSLPYDASFAPWSGVGSPEVAEVPDTHRYKFQVRVLDGQTELLAVTLSYPELALARVTLSYLPATDADAAIWNGWNGALGAMPVALVHLTPVVKVDGVAQPLGAGTTTLGRTNTVSLTVMHGELSDACVADPDATQPSHCVNKAIYPTITAGASHAITPFAWQTSDRVLQERAAKLLASVRSTAPPSGAPPYADDDTLGEFLHLALLEYYRHVDDGAREIGRLDGVSTGSGHHIGMTVSQLEVDYLFDTPFAVFPTGLLVDVAAAMFSSHDLTTGLVRWPTFKLIGYTVSAYEHRLWQETARLEAVSAVRGIQYANERGIPIVTLDASNIACYDAAGACGGPLMDASMSPYKDAITASVNAGATVLAPREKIAYVVPGQRSRWDGAVWIAENEAAGTLALIISGVAGGGFALFEPASLTFEVPFDVPENVFGDGVVVNSTTAANGVNVLTVSLGDPVNMVTGNVFHVERDLTIKGRGGLPFVFERSYNSRAPHDGPLGFGWTHSFNHVLRFHEYTGGVFKVGWLDGTGGEKFFTAAVPTPTIPRGTIFGNPAGVFVDFRRLANGFYTIVEKSGLSYVFESIDAAVGDRARLLSIVDRNGNTLALSYDGPRLVAVTDALDRRLTFTHTADARIAEIRDWTGRAWQYAYDASGDLVSAKSPLAVTGALNATTYAYYDDPLNAELRHALRRYTLPRGNGMTFEYYVNGRAFRHFNDLGETSTFVYNEFTRETTVTDERGTMRRYAFDANGNPVSIEDGAGVGRHYTYDPAKPMNRVTTRNALGSVTRYTYDDDGNITEITLPSGATVVSSDFTAFAQPGKVKDARGNYRVMKYDASGNLLEMLTLKAGVGAAVDPRTYVPSNAELVAWEIRGYDAHGNLRTAKRVRDVATQAGPSVEYVYDADALNVVAMVRRGDKDGDGVVDASESDTATLESDALGRVTLGLSDAWMPTRAAFDANDRIVRASDPLGNLRDYELDANGNLVRESLVVDGALVDEKRYAYDVADRRIAFTDAGGFTTRYAYDAAGNMTAITNPDGYTMRTEYDANNHAIATFDAAGHGVVRALDVDGKPREIVDANGTRVTFSYYGPEREGRLQTKTDGVGRVTTYDYDAAGNQTHVIDDLGRATLTTYDELNRAVRVVGPQYTDAVAGLVRPVVRTTYDLLGNVVRVDAGRTSAAGTDPSSDVLAPQMTYVWDDFGRKLAATDALNRTWRWAYDVLGNPVMAQDARGEIVRASYGAGRQLQFQMDRVTGGSGPMVGVTRSTRAVTTTAPPSGYAFVYRGLICVKTAATGCAGGDLTLEPGLGPVVGYVRMTAAPGAVAVYRGTCYSDGSGTCTRWGLTPTPNGAPIAYLSPVAPDATSATAPLTSDGGIVLGGMTGSAVAYAWTPTPFTFVDTLLTNDAFPGGGYTPDGGLGFLHAASAPDRAPLNRYVETATGRHYYSTTGAPPSGYTLEATLGYVETTDTGGGLAIYRHVSPGGDYVVTTSATPPVGFRMDARLGYVHSGNAATYVHNALGQVVTASNDAVTYTYTYDAGHRLATVTDSRGNKTLSYDHTPAGLVRSLSDSDGGRMDYLYDAVGRLIAIWAANGDAVDFAYDAGGRLTEKWFPNGVNAQYRYHPDGTLAQLKNRVGYDDTFIVSQHDYTYDGAGNRATHRERVGGVTTPYRYVYDPLDRLIEVRNSVTGASLERYAYDVLGNRVAKIAGGVTTAYVYDAANQLLEARQDSATGALVGAFVYDANGNLTKRCDGLGVVSASGDCSGPSVAQLRYDGLGQLVQIDRNGSSEAYVYDTERRRIAKGPSAAPEVTYLYDDKHIHTTYGPGWSTATATYAYGPHLDDGPIVKSTAADAEYFHQDVLGSVVATTDRSGAVRSSARYDVWGNVLAGTGVASIYGYTGREPDATGLVYYRARYYDPALGRFLQRDPLGVRAGLNLYAYVANNPTNYNDPLGELALLIPGSDISGARDSVWWQPKSDFATKLGDALNEQVRAFDWTGGNSREARSEAANALFARILETAVDETVYLVAHSHGGNVIPEALAMMRLVGVTRDIVVVTMATPVRSDYQFDMSQVRVGVAISVKGDLYQQLGGNALVIPGVGEVGPAGQVRAEFGARNNLFINGDHGTPYKDADLTISIICQRVACPGRAGTGVLDNGMAGSAAADAAMLALGPFTGGGAGSKPPR